MLIASIIIAVLADRLIGEVSRFHPLVGFGYAANWVETHSRKHVTETVEAAASERAEDITRERWAGGISWILLVVIPTIVLAGLISAASELATMLTGIVVLYFCIGGRSLIEHARAIATPLSVGNLDSARKQLSRIVSRDTTHLDGRAITAATIESVLENGSDAVLAPLFWFAVAGAPGALCYRLSNTLDAMWGYRNQRYRYFGQTAARMDDVLNWLPARCCALTYALVGRLGPALRCWRIQAPLCDSPNAGPVMAAGAGALGVHIGGPAVYEAESHWRPSLGEGRSPETADIECAISLLGRATALWLLVIALGEFFLWR